MSLIQDISNILESNGCGIIATDIFYNEFPPTPDDCIVIKLSNGGSPTNMFDGCLRNQGFQILCRGIDYIATEEKMNNIFKLIHMNKKLYVLIKAESDYMYIGNDDKNRNKFSANFSVIKY